MELASANRTGLPLALTTLTFLAMTGFAGCSRQVVTATPSQQHARAQDVEVDLSTRTATIRGNSARILYELMARFEPGLIEQSEDASNRALREPLRCIKSERTATTPEPEDMPPYHRCESAAGGIEGRHAEQLIALLEVLDAVEDRLVWTESGMSKTHLELHPLDCRFRRPDDFSASAQSQNPWKDPSRFSCIARQVKEPIR